MFNVSSDTVRRRGLESQLRSRIAHRDYLKKCHRRARFLWCLRQRHNDFRNWIFSDESCFELRDCSAPRRIHVHRGKKEKYVKCCILPTPVQSTQKLMVWACITAQGRGPLVFVDGNIDATKFKEILRDDLVLFVDELPISRRFNVLFKPGPNPTPAHKLLISFNH